MPQPTIALEYWDGDSWVKAVTHTGNNAVRACDIGKIADETDQAFVTLSNPPKNARSTDTSKSKGLLTDVFLEDGVNNMKLCLLRDEETGMVLFRGKVHKIRHRYEIAGFGSSLKLELRDELQELADLPLEASYPSLKSIDLSKSGQTPDTTKRSGIIQQLVQTLVKTYRKTSESNHGFSDTDKFESSAQGFTEKDVIKSANDNTTYLSTRVWDLTGSSANALEMVQLIAQTEPHDAADLSQHYGYDFYLDPNLSTFDTSNSEIKPPPSFNYFKRGTRPGAAGTTAATPQKHGITFEYPSSNWPTISAYSKKGFIRQISEDADFDVDENTLATALLAEWEFDNTPNSDASGSAKYKQTFELMKATIPSGKFTDTSSEGKSLWEGRRLLYESVIADFNKTTLGTHSSTSEANAVDAIVEIFVGTNDQSTDTENPTFLYASGDTYPTALLHYASGSGNGTNADYVILSNVFDTDETVPSQTDNEYDLYYFKGFPSGAWSRINMGSGITDTATALTVDDASVFSVNDVIRVEDELMNISAVNTTTNVLTVGREYSSTSGVAHADNVYVYKSIRLHTRKSKATNATDVPYIDITPSIGRPSEKYNVKKPRRRTFHKTFSNTDLVRKEIANELDVKSSNTTIKAKVRTTRYPYTRLIIKPANVTRGTDASNNLLTFATAPTASTAINMASDFQANETALTVDSASGFSVGDIIACTTSSVTEQMQITAINSNTFTVTRAVNGTTAVEHADDLAVTGAPTFTTADGTTATNDIRTFGVKKGMIIAQLQGDGSTVKRYAYITEVTSSTIRYGNRITVGGANDQPKDTSDFLEIGGKVDEVASGISNSSSVTTITVDTGTRFEANDVIKINSEQMLVTAVSGNTLTVVRGHNNTDLGTHSVDADIHIYNDLAVFVPVETGHSVRLKHKQWGVDSDFFVDAIKYEVTGGLVTTTLDCVGLTSLNGNQVGVRPFKRPTGKHSDRGGGGSDNKQLTVTLPLNQQTFTVIDGSIQPKDGTHIEVKPDNPNALFVTLVTGNGQRYQIRKTDGTTAYPHLDVSGGVKTGQLFVEFPANAVNMIIDYNTTFEHQDVIFIAGTPGSSAVEQLKVNRITHNGTTHTTLWVDREYNGTTKAVHADNTTFSTGGYAAGQAQIIYFRPAGYGAAKGLQVAPYKHGAPGTNYTEIGDATDIIIGWAQADKFSYRGSSNIEGLTGGVSSPLNGAISDAPAAGTRQDITVDTGSSFSIGDVILAEEEEMSVYGISSNTLSVTRGVNGTATATHADDTSIDLRERFNTNPNAKATLKLNGTGSFGDGGSIDIKELSEGAFPGYHGNSHTLSFENVHSRIALQDPTNASGVVDNPIHISSAGLSFQIPATASTQINMAGNLGNNASTDTSVVVDDASVFAVNSIITIDSEKMKISGISSNTLTVTRAQHGTSVASHNDNAYVYGLQGHNELAAGPDKKIIFYHNPNAIDTTGVSSGSTYFYRMGASPTVQDNGTITGVGRNLFIDDQGSTTELGLDTTTSQNETLAIKSRLQSNNVAFHAPRYYAAAWQNESHGSEKHPSYSFSTDLDTGMYTENSNNLGFTTGGTQRMNLQSGGIYVTGDGYKTTGAGDWSNFSDDRIKTNIASLTNSMAVIEQLNPVSYKYTANWQSAIELADNETQIGYLASEFATVFPNQVSTTGHSLVKFEDGTIKLTDRTDLPESSEKVTADIKVINTGFVVPHLVAAVKELKAEIDDIKDQLNG